MVSGRAGTEKREEKHQLVISPNEKGGDESPMEVVGSSLYSVDKIWSEPTVGVLRSLIDWSKQHTHHHAERTLYRLN